MSTPRKQSTPIARNVITNCNFQNGTQVNEHTRAAVEALANAAKANAEAINAIAMALRGGNAHMDGPMLNFHGK